MQKQEWNAPEYSEHAAFVSSMAGGVLALLNPQPGEHILDLGCGDGELALTIQQQGCTVVGIDASASMVESAKARGINAQLVDGHALDFHNEFDAVFSNAALHWLTEPEKVIKGVHGALKNNGRFVAEMGGDGNIAALLKAMAEVFEENPSFGTFKHPWYFPTVDGYKNRLEKAGFMLEAIELIPRPTPLESGLEKWLEIFADSISSQLNKQQKPQFFSAVKEKLSPVLYSEKDGWVADYVRLRFAAIKQ
ncbi:MAG: methyltransferase domain-containing protein [Gammaproteobacteria bacterium]|nr:methyltransferase domain-containing protein [Gammaproteobacteria bacterium]MBQ0839230.1 methyltransferase domain-containing protein [Gammaproteobacteria bacterium]